jgi:hypothetical protein
VLTDDREFSIGGFTQDDEYLYWGEKTGIFRFKKPD